MMTHWSWALLIYSVVLSVLVMMLVTIGTHTLVHYTTLHYIHTVLEIIVGHMTNLKYLIIFKHLRVSYDIIWIM